jgi:16S rRNA (adenine1518-N6/adenine1519-N6)-dimethyltransferase
MIRARKRFGQHFLEPAWVSKVVEAIDPKREDVFLEIGPGRGALTRPLANCARAVIAFEIDRDLAAGLRATGPSRVTVVEGDFLETVENRLPRDTPVRVAGNLPYNVASPILFKLVEMSLSGVRLTDATVMLQREVADRLLAEPGSKEYGVLSVLMSHSTSIERLLSLPPGAFRPPPQVRSTLVRLRFHPPDPPVRDATLFAALVRAVFSRRRKTLANALHAYRAGPPIPAALALARADIDGGRRPETLSVAEFARLADVYAGARQPGT